MSSHRAFMDRWFHELWTKRNPAIVDECVSDDCLIIGLPEADRGRASFHGFFELFGKAFPEVHIRVDDCVSEGESFAVRCSGHTLDHEGKKHPLTGAVLGKIRGGKLVEAYNQWDFLGVLDSMGVVRPNLFGATITQHAERAKA